MSYDRLWMAPMLGFTEQVFRNTYVKHFDGFDAAIAPFTTLVEGKKVKERHLKDLLPEANRSLKTIPQVIGNKGEQFVLMNKYLIDLGYDEVNWNLGCPAQRVASRKRGSGLLPYPETIDSILETIFQNPHPDISVKIRLGYQSTHEIEKVIPVLNQYPLKQVCIHPRLGSQCYEGTVDLKTFAAILPHIKFPIIYSGDIFTLSDFIQLRQKFPDIHDFMLGRGIFSDPFLPEKIRDVYSETADSAKIRFEKFALELFDNVIKNSTFELNALNKTKEYWVRYSLLYQNSKEIFDQIKVCKTTTEMRLKLIKVFENEKFCVENRATTEGICWQQ